MAVEKRKKCFYFHHHHCRENHHHHHHQNHHDAVQHQHNLILQWTLQSPWTATGGGDDLKKWSLFTFTFSKISRWLFAEHIALNIVVVYFVKLCKHSLVITQDGFTLSATMSTAMMETSGTKRYCQYKLSSSSSFLTLESSSLLTSLVTKKNCHYQICPDVETCTANCALGSKLAINWIMNYEYQLNY